MIIAVDFDGTIVKHRYPEIGAELPFATDTLKMLQADGHRLILWSVREGDLLAEAVAWCAERGVEFYAVNRDYPEESTQHKGFSRKLKADLFIDDRNLGGLPPWGTIYHMIKVRKHLLPPSSSEEQPTTPHKYSWIERVQSCLKTLNINK